MILSKILEAKEREVEKRKSVAPLETIKESLSKMAVVKSDFKKAVSAEGINLIAELKQRSPSKGLLRKDFNPVMIALDYAVSGAKALSVLTDEEFFGGKLAFIREIKKDVKLPILQKDFIIDEYQLYEAKSYGADAVLLIADILTKEEIASFLDIAGQLGMDAVCEVHSGEDLEKVLAAPAEIIGINNRSLHDFKVDMDTTARLVRDIFVLELIEISSRPSKLCATIARFTPRFKRTFAMVSVISGLKTPST